MEAEIKALTDEVQTTNRLLALMLTKGLNQTEAIKALGEARLQPNEIALILGTTPSAVRARLSESRTNKTQKRK